MVHSPWHSQQNSLLVTFPQWQRYICSASMVHPLPLPPIKPVLIPLEHAVVRPLVRARIAAQPKICKIASSFCINCPHAGLNNSRQAKNSQNNPSPGQRTKEHECWKRFENMFNWDPQPPKTCALNSGPRERMLVLEISAVFSVVGEEEVAGGG